MINAAESSPQFEEGTIPQTNLFQLIPGFNLFKILDHLFSDFVS